jgi:hypothetical protein
VRTLIAVVVSFAIQSAAFTAPLVHEHPDDHASDHHHGRVTHAHWSGHQHASRPADSPAIQADDHDRAVFLNAFVAVGASPLPRHAMVFETFEPAMPADRLVCRGIDIVRSHDPPLVLPTPSRAPPAFSS